MEKKFKLQASELVLLTDFPGYCFATDDITVKGKSVGYMYRELTEKTDDSGWRFFSGEESDEQVNEPSYLGLYSLNTIANYDRRILPYLNSPYGRAFGKTGDGDFIEEPFFPEIG